MAFHYSRLRRVRTAAVSVLGAGVGSVLLLAGPASAHVRVFSEGASEGHPATLRFRVPAEKATVTTVRVEVTLPSGVRPVSYPDVTGWTHTSTAFDGTTHVVWTARAGHEIEPDDHQYFPVRVGPLPHRASLGFDTVQTYSDGSVVDWNQSTGGGREPEFPRPLLILDAAAKDNQSQPQSGAPGSVLPAPGVSAAAPAAAGAPRSDTSWVPWAVTGLAAVAAVVGVVTGNRRRLAWREKARTTSPGNGAAA
ncbi:DUF1775 domain-containing protein [Streptomyces sp. NPDC006654]|uniref:DUF1775 domain-containing protein n=1 Tax=Streptomyces sp. NPDC006654 TaxID=3156897 RepID=UPI0033DF300D